MVQKEAEQGMVSPRARVVVKKMVYVKHLYEVEEFFTRHETHVSLMRDKKITVHQGLMGGFDIKIE